MFEELNLDPEHDNLPSYKGTTGALDGGDSGHNAFTLLYCAPTEFDWSTFNWREVLWSPDGWPRRSSNEYKWYGRPGRCSRDLLTPALIYEASWGVGSSRFWGLMLAMAKHGFCFANNTIRNHVYETEAEHMLKSTPDVKWRPEPKVPDFLGPDIWSICIRGAIRRANLATRAVCFVPVATLLCVLDLHLLGSALFTKLHNADMDQRNQALKTHFSSTYWPTPISLLAMAIYRSTQPCKAFTAHWTKPGEPAVHTYMCELYRL